MKTFLNHRRRRGNRAFTLMEVMLASAISSVAMLALISLNVMVNRFMFEGAREARILGDATLGLKDMERRLNCAYRLDADTASYVYAISNSNQTVTFSAPDITTPSTINRERFRYDSTSTSIIYERYNGTSWVQVGSQAEIKNVDKFAIDNQEGILTMTVRLKMSIPRYKDRQVTLLGRALPRNI